MSAKRDDPKRLKLRDERERATAWVEILCKGIGHALADGYRHEGSEDVRRIIARVNGELAEAVDALDRAEKAYEPYWARRRRVSLGHRVKKAKPAAAVVQ